MPWLRWGARSSRHSGTSVDNLSGCCWWRGLEVGLWGCVDGGWWEPSPSPSTARCSRCGLPVLQRYCADTAAGHHRGLSGGDRCRLIGSRSPRLRASACCRRLPSGPHGSGSPDRRALSASRHFAALIDRGRNGCRDEGAAFFEATDSSRVRRPRAPVFWRPKRRLLLLLAPPGSADLPGARRSHRRSARLLAANRAEYIFLSHLKIDEWAMVRPLLEICGETELVNAGGGHPAAADRRGGDARSCRGMRCDQGLQPTPWVTGISDERVRLRAAACAFARHWPPRRAGCVGQPGSSLAVYRVVPGPRHLPVLEAAMADRTITAPPSAIRVGDA
jgi:hypothetical protein